jgi:hypothetical protein
VDFTNLTDTEILFFSLVKKGYGTLKEIRELDTMDIMNILEFEGIIGDIETLAMEEA